jgi:terminase small subunit-like protein
MAARPKQRRFTAAIERIAKREGFETPEAGLEWVISEIEAGVSVAQLWKVVQEEANESSTRTWSYTVLYGLAKDARARIKEARKVGAVALLDEAMEVADGARPGGAHPVSNAAEAASVRLAVDTRLRLAGMFNRDEFGNSPAKVQIGVSVGDLMLAAFQQRRPTVKVDMPQQLTDGSTDYEVLPSG